MLIKTPIPFFHCPSRRSAILYPHYARYNNDFPQINPWPEESAKSDYAANAGDDTTLLSSFGGPATLQQGDTTFKWNAKGKEAAWKSTGICYPRSEVRIRDISDGTTNTILVGEKCLRLNNYEKGYGAGDDQNLYAGYNSDTFRATGHIPVQDYWDPLNSDVSDHWFGSAHNGGLNVAMCDGSVHAINYGIDEAVFKGIGNRMDAKPTANPFE